MPLLSVGSKDAVSEKVFPFLVEPLAWIVCTAVSKQSHCNHRCAPRYSVPTFAKVLKLGGENCLGVLRISGEKDPDIFKQVQFGGIGTMAICISARMLVDPLPELQGLISQIGQSRPNGEVKPCFPEGVSCDHSSSAWATDQK